MRQSWRWAVVAAGVAILVAIPFAAHLLPAGHSDVSAQTLLQRVRTSAGVDYSGLAQSTGGLVVPLSSSPFDAVSGLFGGTKQMRVWWRGTSDWRVDTIGATGESDLYHTIFGEWNWNYESNTARYVSGATTPIVRLPRTEDLLPSTLAQRLLSEAPSSAVSRLPSERIAGHDAAGLRVSIDDPASTLRHIDVWADPGTGLALRVSVYGAVTRPVVTTSFLDLTIGTPPGAITEFRPVPGEQAYDGGVSDIVAAIDRFGRSTPPATIAGLPRRRDLQLGAVGVYGRGATILVALPLDYRLSDDVVGSLTRSPSVRFDKAGGASIAAGPINIELSPLDDYGGRWLLVGTVRQAALEQAATGLPAVPDNEFGR